MIKKILFLPIIIWSFILWVNTTNASSFDQIDNYIESNKSLMIKTWNDNTSVIANYTNQDGCDTVQKYINEWKKPDLFLALGCYTYRNWKSESQVVARTMKESVYNIIEWLKLIDKNIIRPWETYSINNVFENYGWFKDSNALFYEDNKVTTKKVSWGGLCWVSSQMYQSVLTDNNISVVERHPHMNFYDVYYGKWRFWLDATIYFWYKDLKLKNTSDQNILIRWYYIKKNATTIDYSVQMLHPFKEKRDYTVGKSWKSKSGKTCTTTIIGWKEEVSCYYNWIK